MSSKCEIAQCDACGAEGVKGHAWEEEGGIQKKLCRFCYSTSFGMMQSRDNDSGVKRHISQCFNTLAEILEESDG